MPGVEVWKASVHVAGTAAAAGERAEREGFFGLSFGDTQHLAADPYIGLCIAARATTHLQLVVGVTNPITRHPAVTANAIATVQVESDGRAVLGIGRGDSSLGHLGQPPARVEVLARYLEDLQRFLGTGAIPWIGLGSHAKVPVDVAASGPAVITLGARSAERVSVNVGAVPERVAWAIETAALAVHPGAPSPSLGAYLVVACHPDRRTARHLARGPLAPYAHFAGMPGSPKACMTEADRVVVERLTADYDLDRHGRADARHVAHLADAFVDRFAVVGPPEHCVARLRELIGLGLDRLILVEGRDPSRVRDEETAHRCLVDEVLPALVTPTAGERPCRSAASG